MGIQKGETSIWNNFKIIFNRIQKLRTTDRTLLTISEQNCMKPTIIYIITLNQQMSTIKQLQREIQFLTDQINDVFHATQLNFQAIKIRLNQNQKGDSTITAVTNCQKQYINFKNIYEQRNNLRLQYLITEQIKLQEQKVRRERLMEYQEKIYDQRRLIGDKQTFFQTLVKPKKKRPANMTIQQFSIMRSKDREQQEKRNFQKLEDQTQQLLKLQKLFRNQTNKLQQQLDKLDRQTGISELTQQQVQNLIALAQQCPVLYDNLHITKNISAKEQQQKQLLDQYIKLRQQDQQIWKDYLQQKQMNKYLVWENRDLIKRYKDLTRQITEPLNKKQKKQSPIDKQLNNSEPNKQRQLKNSKLFKNQRNNSCFERSVSL